MGYLTKSIRALNKLIFGRKEEPKTLELQRNLPVPSFIPQEPVVILDKIPDPGTFTIPDPGTFTIPDPGTFTIPEIPVFDIKIELALPKEIKVPTLKDVQTRREREIRELAYYKWEAAGRPQGDGKQFWIEAEKEVTERKLNYWKTECPWRV